MSSWSTTSRAALISAVAIAVGCLFVSADALALGDPMPRSKDAALVGNGAAHPQIVTSDFHAIDLQRVYAALDLTPPETPAALLSLQLITAAAFASIMAMALAARRWALVPAWVLFIVLGNTSSGGAVSPPLLPSPFAVISQWLPLGATVTALLRRRLLPRLPAHTAGRRLRRLGGGLPRNLDRPSPPSRSEPRRTPAER